MSDQERPGAQSKPGLKLRMEEKLGLLDDLVVVGYRSYGTSHFLSVRGRVLEKQGLEIAADESGTLRNIAATIQRFRSDEIPGARVRIRYEGREWTTFTDEEGFFLVNVPAEAPLETGWHEVDIDLVESVKGDFTDSTTVEVLVPDEDADFAIISDLDDTVIHTGANRLTTKLRTIFAQPARERAQLAGVAPLYHALAGGPDGASDNPVFYLSRSGWNLYEPFLDFFDANDLPKGPLFLQDLAIRESKSRTLGAEHHKLQHARILLHTYPELPFVLFGDSGQGDPETYRQLVHEHPGRIRAIYIRDVTKDARDREVDAIARDVRDRGVLMMSAEDSLAMARHAAHHGLIPESAIADVESAIDR